MGKSMPISQYITYKNMLKLYQYYFFGSVYIFSPINMKKKVSKLCKSREKWANVGDCIHKYTEVQDPGDLGLKVL